jgi:hypothetical protein
MICCGGCIRHLRVMASPGEHPLAVNLGVITAKSEAAMTFIPALQNQGGMEGYSGSDAPMDPNKYWCLVSSSVFLISKFEDLSRLGRCRVS